MVVREIADNKRELDGELANSGPRRKDLETALPFTDDLLSGKTSDIRKLNLGFSIASLNAASWQSAERTGALAQMDYSEVQQYSEVYTIQDLFAEQQRRTIEGLASAMAILSAANHPHQAPAKDLEMFRQQVLALGADVDIQEQIGQQLADGYRRVLEK